MKSVSVVIGTNYGDEGKGLTTDFLADRAGPSTAVVRFNGGAQAGHTVQLIDGRRHVFHHFSSGTFCYAATILSRFFVVNPKLFLMEAFKLEPMLNRDIEVYVDPEALVTTPFDVYINQTLENQRGNQRHGSCGVGFGETIERSERGFPLNVYDLASPDLRQKLEDIKCKYLPGRLAQLGLYDDPELLDGAIERFVLEAKAFINMVMVLNDTRAMKRFDNLIFEGAQGLRLNQYGEDFPYVTRSSTGLENVKTLLIDFEANIDVYYITRTYLTRHGAGPLKGEYSSPLKIDDKTNITNDYQGTLRFAPLDFESMKQYVQQDKKFLDKRNFNTIGVLTCCDQTEVDVNMSMLLANLKDALGTKNIITTWGPTRETVVEPIYEGVSDGVLC